MTGYIEIGGGYKFALLRVGCSLMSPAGAEVYFQPGDDSAAIIETAEAMEEIPAGKRGIIADMAFSEYF